MKLKTTLGKDLSKSLWELMDKERQKQYSPTINLFDRKQHAKSNFFILTDNKKIVAWGFLRPVIITYRKKKYNIFAMGGIMVVEGHKGKKLGTVLIKEMIAFSKKTGKTILGFTGEKTAKFYKKVGLKIAKDFSIRIEMENPKTKERIPDVDGACPGIYFPGKDKFVSDVSKGKEIATYWMPDIKEPHF